jgi:hypothetical protein
MQGVGPRRAKEEFLALAGPGRAASTTLEATLHHGVAHLDVAVEQHAPLTCLLCAVCPQPSRWPAVRTAALLAATATHMKTTCDAIGCAAQSRMPLGTVTTTLPVGKLICSQVCAVCMRPEAHAATHVSCGSVAPLHPPPARTLSLAPEAGTAKQTWESRIRHSTCQAGTHVAHMHAMWFTPRHLVAVNVGGEP